MSEKALRFNEGKAELAYLLDFNRALDAVAKVCSQGAVKYEPRNWKKGGKPDKEYIESCLRHLRDWANEGQYDPDIGTLHIANAAWNLLAMLELNICPDNPVLDPEFDQEAFVAKYTGQKALPMPPRSIMEIVKSMPKYQTSIATADDISDLKFDVTLGSCLTDVTEFWEK